MVRIEDLSIDDLLALNEIICERIDYLRAKEDQEILTRLQLGNQVHFEDKAGRQIFGIVTKINRKTVVAQSQNGTRYKIPPTLLRLVKDVEGI